MNQIIIVFEKLSDPKVAQDDPAIRTKHHIFRLDIPVSNVFHFVTIMHCREKLTEVATDNLNWETISGFLYFVCHRATLDVIHHKVKLSFFWPFDELMKSDYIFM